MSSTPSSGSSGASRDASAYWRKNLRYVGGLLAIWFVASYGAAILFADQLDAIRGEGEALCRRFPLYANRWDDAD